MSVEETKDLAYWERNMLALRYADGWYRDMIDAPDANYYDGFADSIVPRYQGWTRVLSLEGGRITFHIPDSFDVGNLPLIAPNWDGHTTPEKWRRVMSDRNIEETP